MKKVFFLLLIIIVATSCEDLLDKQPLDKISEATFWNTPEDAIAGLNACYDPLQTYESSNNMCYELMAILDCLTPIGNSRDAGMASIANGNIDPTNNRVYEWWTSQYKGIVRCNDLLENITSVPLKLGRY
ncbi:MAG: hypothetical protein RBS73_11105 [Prolixibacteraceae bacterium]|jgi:hypothetical protein|nr:hypothetical protein [Prolixibacteraceae bacterium]